MSGTTPASLKQQLDELTTHLEQENPELLGVVQSFRKLDKVAYRLGLLDRSESFATRVSWWPLISLLGTFSSGKSTFINSYLGQPLQTTGNQAVDDKFTVICYGRGESRVLPGLALDSDPRFPFYRISREIDEAMSGEGQRLDSYLQLKTADSEQLRGKILIDSPGFDADAQRTSTLRITNHIIDLADLVLVFFDARHPEPGAMPDTLEYLVAGTLNRPDFNKFLHVLNQIDNAAREDNPEEVFAAWQRALAHKGLTAGRFYRIYDPVAAVPIEDAHLRQRFETKRDQDMDEIMKRIDRVEVERSYRVAGRLEQTAKRVRDLCVPRLEAARRVWRRRVLLMDTFVFGALAALLLGISIGAGWWSGLRFAPPWLEVLSGRAWLVWTVIALVGFGALQLHRSVRRFAARGISARIRRDEALGDDAEAVDAAFARNVNSWRPIFGDRPLGWGPMTRRRLDAVLGDADNAIRALNDRYTNPSGDAPVAEHAPGSPEPASGSPDAASGRQTPAAR